jgi:hypothetical protein
MATVAATKGISPRFSVKPGSRPSEHLFFSGMAFLILILVFVGFAKRYFLAGAFRATLANLLIHVHGAAFTCWILLLVTRTSLVSAGRVDIHRRLGVLGFLLASLMVTLWVPAGTNMLARGGPPGKDSQTFYAVTMLDMLLFGTVVFLAFRARKRPDSHKRARDNRHNWTDGCGARPLAGRLPAPSHCRSIYGLIHVAPQNSPRNAIRQCSRFDSFRAHHPFQGLAGQTLRKECFHGMTRRLECRRFCS